MGLGKTPASSYGQLVELATKHANQLTNVEFSVVLKRERLQLEPFLNLGNPY